MRQKLVAGLLIAFLIAAGVVIWIFIGAETPEVGFPSAVGQSLTYGIYENDNRVYAITQTVSRLELSRYNIDVTTPDFDYMDLSVRKRDGRIYSTYAQVRLDTTGRKREQWCYTYSINTIMASYEEVVIGSENRAFCECDMPEDFVSWWEDLYIRFGKEPLSLGYSKQFNFINQITKNFAENSLDITFATRTAEVEREETLTVQAGTFDCYVVEITGGGVEENLSIWVDKQLRITVQWERDGQAAKLESYSGF